MAVGQIIPEERLQQRIVEHLVDMLVRQVMEKIVEVVHVMPQERIQCTMKEIVEVPEPQIQEHVSLLGVSPSWRVLNRSRVAFRSPSTF